MKCSSRGGRNRIRETGVNSYSVATWFAFAAIAAVVLVVVYSGLKNNNKTLNSEILQLEKKHDELVTEKRCASHKWSECRAQVISKLNRHGISMRFPNGDQVISLKSVSLPGYAPADSTAATAYVSR